MQLVEAKWHEVGLQRAGALLFLLFLIAALSLKSQQPAAGQKRPTADAQNGQSGTQTKPATEGNPFPGEENNAPVLPTNNTPIASSDESYTMSGNLPQVDTDPVRSPEDSDAMVEQPSGVDALESSSLAGLHDSGPEPDSTSGSDGKGGNPARGGHGKKGAAEVKEHVETASEDVDVGNLYLDKRNWKAALSRFQSARVLDPENPDAFFGMAEAEMHLGDKTNARAHYEKVVEYDPDSRHGKAARKALKELGESH